jgi:hypothetical protein
MSEVDDLRDGWKIIHQQMKEKKGLVVIKRDMLFL